MSHGRSCAASISAYARGQHEENQAIQVEQKVLNLQAERSAELARLLSRNYVALLTDPTGSGKTAIALAAAKSLLDASVVETLVVVAPNERTATQWEHRARWVGLTDSRALGPSSRRYAKSIYARGRLTVTTTAAIRKSGFPRPDRAGLSPEKALFIIDEAHRGFGNHQTETALAATTIMRGARVLAVTATPVQLSSTDLLNLLRLRGPQDPAVEAALADYSRAVSTLLAEVTTDISSELPALVDSADLHLRSHLLEPHPWTTTPQPTIPPPTLRATAVELTDDEELVLNTLRMVAGIGESNAGDRFYRAITSSWSAVKNSTVWHHALKTFGVLDSGRSFLEELESRMDPLATPHPKVTATTRWVTDKIEVRPRNVLIFTWSKGTQQELHRTLEGALKSRATVEAPESRLTHRQQRQFRRSRSSTDSSLIVVARNNMSESIDLDGGDPCLVHHDVGWNPVEFRQRWGRVCRVSSNFEPPRRADVYVPYLNIAGSKRMIETLQQRLKFVEAIERRDLTALRHLIEIEAAGDRPR